MTADVSGRQDGGGPQDLGGDSVGAGGDGFPALLGDIAALAAEVGDEGAADGARAAAATVATHAARVVVVGEAKRGKSSLINALLRRPGLLPVDVDIATSVHVVVYPAESEEAYAVVDRDRVPVSPGQIAEYAALIPKQGQMRHQGVSEVGVGLPDDLLRAGIELIDTPGVGGLVSGHADLTLAALSLADALLFVASASGELKKSELDFLARATERIENVAFVLTQIDKYPAWRAVLDKDRQLVAGHAPRFADAQWYPVSSQRRLDAIDWAAAGRTARAADLAEASGFGPLERVLRTRIAGRAASLRDRNASLTARRVLKKLTDDAEARRRSLAGDPALLDEVEAKKRQLDDARAARAPWRGQLDTGFENLTQELRRLYGKRLVDLQGQADQWIATADAESASRFAHSLDAGLRGMWGDLLTTARTGALKVAAGIADSLEAAGVDALLDADLPYPEQLGDVADFRVSPPGPDEGLPERLTRLWPSLSGFSMTAMAAHMIVGAAFLPPLALVGAGLIPAVLLYQGNRARAAKAQARADLRRHVDDGLRTAGAEMLPPLLDEVAAMKARIRDMITERMAVRERELSDACDEAVRHRQESESALRPQRDAADEVLTRLRALRQRANQLMPGAVRPAT